MPGIVLFDLDNTLVHSRIDFAAIRRDVVQILRDHDVTDKTLEELGHFSIGQIIGIAEAHDAVSGSDLGPRAWQLVLAYECAGMLAATVEYDAATTLALLGEHGWKRVVLTNNARPATVEVLHKFDLEPCLDLILTRDDVPMKPSPDGILHAVAHHGGATANTVMVGDSWLDGKAAQNAGVPFLAFGPVMEKLQQREIPVWQNVERLSELPELLRSVGTQTNSDAAMRP